MCLLNHNEPTASRDRLLSAGAGTGGNANHGKIIAAKGGCS